MSDPIAVQRLPAPVFVVVASVVYRDVLVMIIRAEGAEPQVRHVYAAVEADDLSMSTGSPIGEPGELVVGLYEVKDEVTCHGWRRFLKADAVETLRRYFGLNGNQAGGCLSQRRLAKLYAEGKTIDGGEANAADGQ